MRTLRNGLHRIARVELSRNGVTLPALLKVTLQGRMKRLLIGRSLLAGCSRRTKRRVYEVSIRDLRIGNVVSLDRGHLVTAVECRL